MVVISNDKTVAYYLLETLIEKPFIDAYDEI